MRFIHSFSVAIVLRVAFSVGLGSLLCWAFESRVVCLFSLTLKVFPRMLRAGVDLSLDLRRRNVIIDIDVSRPRPRVLLRLHPNALEVNTLRQKLLIRSWACLLICLRIGPLPQQHSRLVHLNLLSQFRTLPRLLWTLTFQMSIRTMRWFLITIRLREKER